MDPELKRLLTLLVIIAVGFFWVARVFYRIFLKPFLPRPGELQGPPRKHELQEFLEEIRQDQGQRTSPPPMDRERQRPLRRTPPKVIARQIRDDARRARPAFLETAEAAMPAKRPFPAAPLSEPSQPLRDDPFGIDQLLALDIRKAIVLREILGPPRAHRRHHRWL